MSTLFPDHPLLPEGFFYQPGFLSPEEEEMLLEAISGILLQPFLFSGYTAKRKVATFGLDWNFEHRTLRRGAEIPVVFVPLLRKVAGCLHVPPEQFRELLVTEYPPGSVINWHRDAPPFELIAGVSLAADCLFRLRPHPHIPGRRATTVSLPVERRSLYCMQGPVRWDWQHSTRPVVAPRFSITLRTLRANYPVED